MTIKERIENKELLLQDLCARLPYGVKAQVSGWDEEKGEIEVPLRIYSINTDGYVYFESNDYDVNYIPIEDVRYYLRPMSSMTEDEIIEFNNIPSTKNYTIVKNDLPWHVAHYKQIEWLDKKMFDYRGLIPAGLALSTEEFDPYV